MKRNITITKYFREGLTNYLAENNISRADFASITGISVPTIGKIISGKQKSTSQDYYNIINNIIQKRTNFTDTDNNISEIDIINFANHIKKKYDITPLDMTRIFETTKENINNLLKGNSVSVALFMKLSYYYDKETELVDLFREKRFTLSNDDKEIVDNKVKELYNEGYNANQLATYLHTSVSKVQSIIDGTDDFLGYPANVHGRRAFNEIINGTFEIENSCLRSNYESNNIEKDQLVYHYQYGSDDEDIDEYNTDENEEVHIELLEDQDNIKTITLDGEKYICFLTNNEKTLSDNNIKRISQIIDIMTTIDEEKIKINCDIDI